VKAASDALDHVDATDALLEQLITSAGADGDWTATELQSFERGDQRIKN
jgi:hypothetical protein